MRGQLTDIAEKLVVFGVFIGIFLPVRMLFYAYFSAHWIGSLGIVSSLMFILIFLSHKHKLGRFGELFMHQMTKTIKGKSGKVAIILSLMFIAYFGSTLMWIERGNTVYLGEKQMISQTLFSNYNVNNMGDNDMNKILQTKSGNGLLDTSRLTYFDQIISMTYAIMNDMTGGWVVNLDTILLVEQFEFLGFIVIYRKMYHAPTTLILK